MAAPLTSQSTRSGGAAGPSPSARAQRTVAAFAVAPALVAALVVGVAVGVGAGALPGVIAAVAALVVVAVAATAWARSAGDRRVAATVGGRRAEPHRDARLCNLVEGLCTAAGLRQPELRVLESDGLNAMAAGTAPDRAVLVVTTGLVERLERIELEAVLAEELVQIRRRETLPGTVAVATFGVGRRSALAPDRDASADLAAVSLTRYPPALAAALEKIEAEGAIVTGPPARWAHLWLVDPRPSPPPEPGRLPLAERVEALREL